MTPFQMTIAASASAAMMLASAVLAQGAELHTVQATAPHPVTAAAVPAHGAGAWSGATAGRALANSNIVYQTADIAPPATVPGTGKVSTVFFRYTLSAPVANLTVQLCDTRKCVAVNNNVTAIAGNGSTPAFAGDPADTDFALAFFVAGSGAAVTPSVTVVTSTVSVNYTY